MIQAPTKPGPVEIVFHPGPNGERDVALTGRVVAAVVRALDEHRAEK